MFKKNFFLECDLFSKIRKFYSKLLYVWHLLFALSLIRYLCYELLRVKFQFVGWIMSHVIRSSRTRKKFRPRFLEDISDPRDTYLSDIMCVTVSFSPRVLFALPSAAAILSLSLSFPSILFHFMRFLTEVTVLGRVNRASRSLQPVRNVPIPFWFSLLPIFFSFF